MQGIRGGRGQHNQATPARIRIRTRSSSGIAKLSSNFSKRHPACSERHILYRVAEAQHSTAQHSPGNGMFLRFELAVRVMARASLLCYTCVNVTMLQVSDFIPRRCLLESKRPRPE